MSSHAEREPSRAPHEAGPSGHAKHGGGQSGDAGHGGGHHRNYVKIWAILLVLLVISVFGPFLEIRVITLLTAFGVAVVKAYMVAKNFMHLDVEKRIVKWTLAVAVIFMVMLFAGVSPDVMMDDGSGWKKDAGFHPVEKVGHGDGHGAEAHGDAPGGDAGHGSPAPGQESPGDESHATPAAPDSLGASGDTHDGH